MNFTASLKTTQAWAARLQYTLWICAAAELLRVFTGVCCVTHHAFMLLPVLQLEAGSSQNALDTRATERVEGDTCRTAKESRANALLQVAQSKRHGQQCYMGLCLTMLKHMVPVLSCQAMEWEQQVPLVSFAAA